MKPDLIERLANLGRPRLLVLGDLILDQYTFGAAERVSPEVPVLVLRAEKSDVRPGGAAAVAVLARSLAADVTLAGVVGADEAGDRLCGLLDAQSIDRTAVLLAGGRPTTRKERFLGRADRRDPHHLLRVDHEVRDPLTRHEEDCLLDLILAQLQNCQGLLIADYGKGVCTANVLRTVGDAARQRGIPVVIDPARGSDYNYYRRATLLAPNRIEAETAGGQPIHVPEDALAPARQLREQFQFGAILVKLDRDGMALVQDGCPDELIPTRVQSVHDVTGAGDVVLAMLGLCLASGVALSEAARLANAAAGREVQRLGVAAVTRDEVRAELLREGQSSACKVLCAEQMALVAEAHREAGQTVVFTNGCFDLLHVGHLTCLEEAARLGDVLVVGLNSDMGVRRLKGSGRPVVDQEQRAALLAALGCVSHVVIFDEPTPHRLLRLIRPDVLVKGGTYEPEEVVGHELVEEYGGRVCVTGKVAGLSTTGILQRLSVHLRESPSPVDSEVSMCLRKGD